jgi:hypothetical protein
MRSKLGSKDDQTRKRKVSEEMVANVEIRSRLMWKAMQHSLDFILHS